MENCPLRYLLLSFSYIYIWYKQEKDATKTSKADQIMAKIDAFFSGTDTNPIIISIRGKMPRLQESVTSPKKGKNGICTYQIFKFLSKEGSSDMGVFLAKIVAKQLHKTK